MSKYIINIPRVLCQANGQASEQQYKELCVKCGVMLTINVPIMCYMSEEHGDKTVCNSCYMSYEMWRDDENTDNEEEIITLNKHY